MNGKTGLYEINISTGEASLISAFANGEAISCLYIPQADDITMLNPPTDLTTNFQGSNTTGEISIKAPSTDKSGNILTGDVTVSAYVDGMLMFSIPVAPGGTVTRNVTLEQGVHTLEAICTHPTAGKSERVQTQFYVGTDGPAAVSNLTLTKKDDRTAHLTWDTPTEGEHGGTINPALVYYKIVRMPDGVMLTDEATGNEYDDVISSDLLREYTYHVTSYYRDVEGGTTVSNGVKFGQPWTIPYKETFDTMDDFRTYIVINNNPDPERPQEGIWGWYQTEQCAMYRYATFYDGDDYLITPALHLEANQTYKLRFKARSGRYYPETLEVLLGRGTNISDFTTTLMPRTDIICSDIINDSKFNDYECIINISETDDYCIAFHAVTIKGQFYLYLDDVEVVFGPSALAPDVVSTLNATPGSKATEIDVEMGAPTKDVNGNTLSGLTAVKVFRDNELVHTFSNPAPGATLKFTDTVTKNGFFTYSAIAENENGEGNPTETKVYAGSDLPEAPGNVTHTTANGRDAIITWTAPTKGINGGSISYEPITYVITDQYDNIIAKDVKETTYTDTNIDTSDGQRNMFYFVHAANSAGVGDGNASGFITYGEPYKDAFAESFAGNKFTTQDWMVTVITPSPYMNDFYGRYWDFTHVRTDHCPNPTPQDGDGGMIIAHTDYIGVSSRLISPKINVSGLKNPVLSFWFYHYYKPNDYSDPKETMQVEAFVDGEFTALLEKPIMLINGNGWYRYDFTLKNFVGSKDFQIAFRTNNYLSYDMHIDNITVHDVEDNDLSISAFDVPSMVAIGSTREITVTVANEGVNDATGYTVELYRNNELIDSRTATEPLAFAKEATYKFEVSPQITEMGNTFTYKAVVNYSADSKTANNTSEEKKLTVPTNNLPTVTSIKAQGTGTGIELKWEEPEIPVGGQITEGFEGYEPFTISNFGDWALADLDGSLTYTISNGASETGDYDYPNAGYQMAFQIMNPKAAGIASKLWEPYLGNQMAVCMAAAETSNNDWLISPEVKGGTKVSFMARSVVADYGLEKFWFCYSSTDREASSFKQMGTVNAVPAGDWTRYEFTLPDDARYFAINCVSEDTYSLLIDEITYESTSGNMLEFLGYNIYRDGVKLNSQPLEDGMYTDNDVTTDRNYTYNISAVYDKGESALSAPVTVNTSSTGIETVTTASQPSLYVIGRTLYVKNAAGSRVRVSNVSGQTFYNAPVSENEAITLPKGIYIVSVNDNVTKIILK